MPRSRIFLSYRRQDSEHPASRLAQDLRAHFPREQVFQDFTSIAPGADFAEAVRQGLEHAAAVLVLIGPRWLTAVDAGGRRRLEQTDDWVRHEVAESLRNAEIRVFPVLLDGAAMPSADDLPADLQPLTRRQALPLTARHWSDDAARLVQTLCQVPALQRSWTARLPGAAAQRQRWLVGAGVVALLVLAVFGAQRAGLFRGGEAAAPAAQPARPTTVPAAPQPRHPAAPLRSSTHPVPPPLSARSMLPRRSRARYSAIATSAPEMVVIPAGEFAMGSPADEAGRFSDEGPQHTVRIARHFALGRDEVTVGEFKRFVAASGYRTEAERKPEQGMLVWHAEQGAWVWTRGTSWRTPGFAQDDRHPVVGVSWNDAVAYVDWVSKRTGKQYRLPSEAEWEYAARAGTKTARYWGDDASQACTRANVGDRSLNAARPQWPYTLHDCTDGFVETAPAGRFAANGFALHDMIGNVWEWTQDCWNASYLGAPADGSPWLQGECGRRVVRGGSWDYDPRNARAASRDGSAVVKRSTNSGFRLARTL